MSFAVAGHRTSIRLIMGVFFAFAAGVVIKLGLAEPVDNPCFIDVVRRHLEFYSIAGR